MYEPSTLPLLPRRLFLLRMMRQAGVATLLVLPSLAAGAAGFHWFARQSWIDGLLNSAMLLGGMGPVGDLSQAPTAGKIFATVFALYAGLIFLVIAGV
ncbi:MAG TPA: hypothetical protein VGT98_12925, partial [Candidatus Elarobacter sp.]|nr:hypothetical protein [Candidatus Elarobacter sp.]